VKGAVRQRTDCTCTSVQAALLHPVGCGPRSEPLNRAPFHRCAGARTPSRGVSRVHRLRPVNASSRARFRWKALGGLIGRIAALRRAGCHVRRRRRDTFVGRPFCLGFVAHVASVEAFVAGHDGPPDAGVLAGHGHAGLLPADASDELHEPARDRVISFAGANDGCLGALDEESAKVVVAAFGDAPETRPAAAGVLAGNEPQPGTQLVPTLGWAPSCRPMACRSRS
jgi:hypothetical protein